jgi:phage/plasmid primase-like uncharacterized protein
MDGTLYRVPVQGDRRGAKSGAYAGFIDGHPAGYIENFKTGEKRSWKSAWVAEPQSANDRSRLQREVEERRAARRAQEQAIHDKTLRLLRLYLQGLAPAGSGHPYLRRKGVGTHGIGIGVDQTGGLMIAGGEAKPQVWGRHGNLVIPLQTVTGNSSVRRASTPMAGKPFLVAAVSRGYVLARHTCKRQ